MELYKKIAQYGYLQKTSTNYKFLLIIKITNEFILYVLQNKLNVTFSI